MKSIKEIRTLAAEGKLTPEVVKWEVRERRDIIQRLSGAARPQDLIREIQEIERLGSQ